jgi:hypothetical protein
VILLDELDKVGADFRGDPASALLEVLDPAQNNTFTDHYLDIPFDLSRVLFITTANWLDPIHPALRDRLEVIDLPSYTESEKLQIAKRYLVPRQLSEHGLSRAEVRIPDKTLRSLIQDYTREAGVRQLEREIAALSRKATRRILTNGQVPRPLVLDPGTLKDYLGAARFELNPRAPSQRGEGLTEGEVLSLHDEGEEIAAGAAGAKTMPVLTVREDHEGWGLLVVERAQPFVGTSCLLERDVAGDRFDDVEPFFDLVGYAHRQTGAGRCPCIGR